MSARPVRSFVLAALAVLLAASALTLAPQVSAPRAAAAAQQTRLTIRVECRACSFQLMRHIEGSSQWWGSDWKRVGDDGRVSFTVPTARTRGLTAAVSVPASGNTGAVSTLNLRYEGKSPGDPVSAREARRGRRAAACWAGVTGARATWHVRAETFTVEGLNGRPGTQVRAWASPTARTIGPLQQTWHGTLIHQDIPTCPRR